MKRPRGPELHEFQKDGISTAVRALKNDPRHCFLIHDEMGLGKTIQAFEILEQLEPTAPMLVISPAACTHIWTQNEYYSRRYDVRLFMGEGVSMANMLKMTNRTMVVTSYDTLRNVFKSYIMDRLDQGSLTDAELLRYCQIHGKVVKMEHTRSNLLERVRQIPRMPKGAVSCSAFMKQRWSVIVMDEVHHARAPNGNTAKAIGFLMGDYRLALSGTPIMNNGAELLSIWRYGLGLFDLEAAPSPERCQSILSAISLGRKKADIPELEGILPVRNRNREEVILPWSDLGHKQVYVNIKKDSIRQLESFESMKQLEGETSEDYKRRRQEKKKSCMAKMQMLRQTCLSPPPPPEGGWWGAQAPQSAPDAAGAGGTSWGFHPPAGAGGWNPAIHSTFPPWIRRRIFTLLLSLRSTNLLLYTHLRLRIIQYFVQLDAPLIQPSPKMIYVSDMLTMHHKMLVFCSFRKFFERTMGPWLDQIGVGYRLFCGNSKKRQERALRDFDRLPDVRVLLIVKAAGSVGLNLQHATNVCIIMDPHFNAALDEQAAQRIDRIGQTEEVIVRKLFMQGSIDEAMRLMQQDKQRGIEASKRGNMSFKSSGLFLSKRDTVE